MSLPATLDQAEAFFYAVYIDPLAQPPLPTNEPPALMSSSEDCSGFNVLYKAFSARSSSRTLTHRRSMQRPADDRGESGLSGFHVLGVVLGVSSSAGAPASDHLYVDGQEVSSYVTQAARQAVSKEEISFWVRAM